MSLEAVLIGVASGSGLYALGSRLATVFHRRARRRQRYEEYLASVGGCTCFRHCHCVPHSAKCHFPHRVYSDPAVAARLARG